MKTGSDIPRYTTATGQPVFFMQRISPSGTPSYAVVIEYGQSHGLMGVLWDKYFPYVVLIETACPVAVKRNYQVESRKRSWHRDIVDYLERYNGRISMATAMERFSVQNLNQTKKNSDLVEVKNADGVTVVVSPDSAPRAFLKFEPMDSQYVERNL